MIHDHRKLSGKRVGHAFDMGTRDLLGFEG